MNVLLETLFPNMERMESKMYFCVQVRHGSEDLMTNLIPSRWSIPSIRIRIQMSYNLFALNIEISRRNLKSNKKFEFYQCALFN